MRSDKWAFLLLVVGLAGCMAVLSMAGGVIADVRAERAERARERSSEAEHNRLIDMARSRQTVNEATLLLQQEQAIKQAAELNRMLKTLSGE